MSAFENYVFISKRRVPIKCETKRNGTDRNKTKRNPAETKQNQPKPTESKPTETKRKQKFKKKSICIEVNGGKFCPRPLFHSIELRPTGLHSKKLQNTRD
jgi:hypothetical protein